MYVHTLHSPHACESAYHSREINTEFVNDPAIVNQVQINVEQRNLT